MDADPFGLAYHSVVGGYTLREFEGTYILRGDRPGTPRGRLELYVLELGWTQSRIYARCEHNGDAGWTVIDLDSNTVTGPMDSVTFHERFPSATWCAAQVAWERL